MKTCTDEQSFPKISVLLAAYNSGTTIKASIQSVLDQSYPNIQLIVCDDGTDGFDAEEIRKFAGNNCGNVSLLILHNEKNLGTVRNLNNGLRYAEGKWIMTLAADDCFCTTDAIAKMISALEASGKKWSIAKTALCDEELVPVGESVPSSMVAKLIETEDIVRLYKCLCKNCCLPAGGSIYEISLLKEKNGFDEDYVLVEDWPFFLNLVRRGHVPVLCKEDFILHRYGGVSRKKAGRNKVYQTDLINVLRKEVGPNLRFISDEEQEDIVRYIKEKELGFEFRFSNETKLQKIIWAVRHPGFMLRKLAMRRKKQW